MFHKCQVLSESYNLLHGYLRVVAVVKYRVCICVLSETGSVIYSPLGSQRTSLNVRLYIVTRSRSSRNTLQAVNIRVWCDRAA